jgi:hypothetical protein
MIFNKFSQILIIISFFAFIPLITEAAVLYLEPSEGEYQVGDIFLAEVRIDTQGEYINAVEVNLEFPQDILEVKNFSKGNSILCLWAKEPSFSNGLLSFSGGIPGGYYGSDGLLGKIAFRVISCGFAEVVFQDNSQALLNDGKGTPVELTTKTAVFTILDAEQETSRDEWQEELEKDIIPPELFEMEFHENFIIFSTTDKQTGIDYFLIKQGKSDWEKVDSPYPLADNALQSIIKIRAVDKAGNERIVEYIPEIPEKPVPLIFWIIILILINFSIIIYVVCQKKFKK